MNKFKMQAQVTSGVTNASAGSTFIPANAGTQPKSVEDKLRDENDILNDLSKFLGTRVNEIHVGNIDSFHVIKIYEEDTLLIKLITDPLEVNSIEFCDYFNLCIENRLKAFLGKYAQEFTYVKLNPENSRYVCILPLNNTAVEEETKNVKEISDVEKEIEANRYNTYI